MFIGFQPKAIHLLDAQPKRNHFLNFSLIIIKHFPVTLWEDGYIRHQSDSMSCCPFSFSETESVPPYRLPVMASIVPPSPHFATWQATLQPPKCGWKWITHWFQNTPLHSLQTPLHSTHLYPSKSFLSSRFILRITSLISHSLLPHHSGSLPLKPLSDAIFFYDLAD